MYINKYDILIDKEIDIIFNNLINKKDYNHIIKNLDNLEKIINLKKFTELTNKNNDKIIDITKKIISKYLVCLTINYNEKNSDIIRAALIKSKYFTSEDLGIIFNLYEDTNTLKNVSNEENLEILANEYKSNIKIKNMIDLLNKLGYEYVTNNLKGDKEINIHNIIKTIIFKNYYQKNYRKEIFNLLQSDNNEYEYEYIEIIVPEIKIVDFINIENILTYQENNDGLTQELYDFISLYEENVIKKKSLDEYINILFEKKIVIPIVDDFLRYHKISEKYENNTSTKIGSRENENKRDQTKIRFIISKIDKIKDYYSKKIQNNPPLKKEVEKQFYKPLIHRKAIIMNEIEELSIINKLRKQGKTAIDSNEFFYDLINLRKYAYVNFKDIKKNGFNLSLDNSVTSIRYAPIESKENKTLLNTSIPLESRVLGKYTKANIVGISLIKNNINFMKIKDIKNINVNNKMNSYESFINKLDEFIKLENKENLYWIFSKEDKIKSEFYETNSENNFTKILLKKLYETISYSLYEKIYNKINSYKTIDLYNSNKFIDYYHKKFMNLNTNINDENLYNNLQIFIKSKIQIVTSLEDENEEKIYGMTGDFIKLPVIKKETNDIASIIISNSENIKDDHASDIENAYCQHMIDWSNLSRIHNNDPNRHTRLLYNFIEKYVMTNNDNEYICKSCKQLLDIQSFLSNAYEGGSEGIDIVLTSSRPLEEIYEYSKYKSSIKNMDKIIERISQITNYNYFIGNLPTHKIRRQDIIKQTIDLISIHDETLRTVNMNKRERERNATQKYGISSDNSNFFIFPLSNDIFKFSSKEIDKYKKIKLNNVIVYILFLMLLELNVSQIMNIEFDKNCNLLLFEKFGIKLFDNLYIRINTSNDVILINNYKTLCLVIFYYSCMISKYKLWFHPNSKDSKFSFMYIQKDIIHTLVDMINSIMEVYEKDEKHFLYKIICSKFSNKLTSVYKDVDSTIINHIKQKEKSKIIIDTNSNKIKFIKSKISSVQLDGNLKLYEDTLYDYNICRPNVYFIKNKKPERIMNKILKKEIKSINNNMVIENMRNLAMMYNKDGNLLIKKLSYQETSEINNKDLEIMYKNIKNNKKIFIKDKKTQNIILDNIKKNADNIKQNIQKVDYIQNLIDLINNNIGETIKIRSVLYDTADDHFYLDHDYLGNNLNKPIYLKVNDKKIRIRDNADLKIKVYEINDKSNDIILYYNYYTYHLLGYKDPSRGFVDMKHSSVYIKYIPSIKTIIKTIGLKKINYNINTKDDAINEIRKASHNVKEYIRQIETGLNQIRYKINNFEINPIIKYYQKKISYLELRGEKGKIFKNRNDFLKIQKVVINNIETGYFAAYELAEKSKSYNELISYLISQILNLLEYNKDKFIKSNIIFYFISFIIYLYYLDYEQYTDFEMIKFNYILVSFDDIKEHLIYSDEEREHEDHSEDQEEDIRNQIIDDDERIESLDIEPEEVIE